MLNIRTHFSKEIPQGAPGFAENFPQNKRTRPLSRVLLLVLFRN